MMNSKQVKRLIKKLSDRIYRDQIEIFRIQDEECLHEGLVLERKSNYSYKDPLEALDEWYAGRCEICGKRFHREKAA